MENKIKIKVAQKECWDKYKIHSSIAINWQMSQPSNNFSSYLYNLSSIREIENERVWGESKLSQQYEELIKFIRSLDFYKADFESKKRKELSLEEILKVIRESKLKDSDIEILQISIREIEDSKRYIKSLERGIRLLLNTVARNFRNLRSYFKRHHSFHFKNLDDYHSSLITPCY